MNLKSHDWARLDLYRFKAKPKKETKKYQGESVCQLSSEIANIHQLVTIASTQLSWSILWPHYPE